jgi:ABC-type polysaccharide/polyol phosphate transport system ATPase subunit
LPTPSDLTAIEVAGLVKTYRIGVGRARVREMIPSPLDRVAARLLGKWWWRNTFNALEDVTVGVARASSVGIIGHNGAGKTTLLKAIAGITAPTEGTVTVRGRVAALIDALVGFHPDLTGRENVYLLGAMHGYGRKEMAPRLEQIFEFAEIGDLLDTPVKRFSAGMNARLGFATVMGLDADILLIDEILSVGDSRFQRKCAQRLDEYRARGGTLVFVSHNLGLVRNMTDRAIWLDHGRVVGEGATAEMLARYARAIERRDLDTEFHSLRTSRKAMQERGLHRWGAGGARVEEVSLGEPAHDGSAVDISIRFAATESDEAVFYVGFVDESGMEIGAAASPPVALTGGQGEVRCAIRPLPLRTGIYFPVVGIVSSAGLIRDRWRLDRAVVVDHDGVVAPEGFGAVEIPAEWNTG